MSVYHRTELRCVRAGDPARVLQQMMRSQVQTILSALADPAARPTKTKLRNKVTQTIPCAAQSPHNRESSALVRAGGTQNFIRRQQAIAYAVIHESMYGINDCHGQTLTVDATYWWCHLMLNTNSLRPCWMFAACGGCNLACWPCHLTPVCVAVQRWCATQRCAAQQQNTPAVGCLCKRSSCFV